MKSLNDSLFLKACRREKTDRTPIWLMRQAGRYMKEYRDIRAKHDFLSLCKNSDLASEVTVHAAHTLGVDAAIIFSDLLLIVQPLGFDLSYGKDQGPMIANPFRSAADLNRIHIDKAASSLYFVYDAIQKTRIALKPDIPLIGFAGAPFTMASYIIEGKGSRDFLFTKKIMKEDEKTWYALLEKISLATVAYIKHQISAGCQAIQIFDSWVGNLTAEEYKQYVLPYSKHLIKNIPKGVPIIHFGTQTGHLLSLIREAGGDVIGADWRIELDAAWNIIGHDRAIMGNLDPHLLLETPEKIEQQAKKILQQAHGRPGHIFNLGHGIMPATPVENVHHLIKTVKEYSAITNS